MQQLRSGMKEKRGKANLKESWKLGMLFYLLVFNYPLLDIFNRETQVFGIPLLLFTLVVFWLLFIGAIGLFVGRLRAWEEEPPDREGEQG